MTGESDYVVKPRQIGMSTLALCYIMSLMVLEPGINILWVSQDEDNATAIRNKFRIIWQSAAQSQGSGFKLADVRIDNDGEFSLANGSRLVIRFAGDSKRRAAQVGRGDTVHFVVFTEVAYWPQARKVFEALRPGIEHAKPSILWDTTPNGTTGDGEFFYKRVMSCKEGRIPGKVHFWSWWMDGRYRAHVRPDIRKAMIASLSSEERALMEVKGLDLEQIEWRRRTIAEYDGDIECFKEIYPETFDEAWRSPGKSIFSVKAIRSMMLSISMLNQSARDNGCGAINPSTLAMLGLIPSDCDWPFKYILQSRSLGAGTNGYVRVWRVPLDGKRYFCGVDTSQGLLDGDPQALVVVDDEGAVCAAASGSVSPVHWAGVAQRIASWYGAKLGVENQSTGPEIHRYIVGECHPAEVSRYGADPILSVMYPCSLVANNRAAKPKLISILKAAIDGGITILPDAEMLRQASNFEEKSDGTVGAATGEHDDLIMALAVALRVRELSMIRERQDEWTSQQGLDSAGGLAGNGMVVGVLARAYNEGRAQEEVFGEARGRVRQRRGASGLDAIRIDPRRAR